MEENIKSIVALNILANKKYILLEGECMRLIDKCKLISKIGMKNNMKKEYREVIRKIKSYSSMGRSETTFGLLYYENGDEIYLYIMDKLKAKGFKAEIEMYGCNMSHKRLRISWK